MADELSFADWPDRLKVEGINCKGYGILPKYVMFDLDLTLEAKAIYAYFCSYSGRGDTAFPGRSKILADLLLGKDAYYTHFHLLTQNGYITVKQQVVAGKKANNLYTLVAKPAKFKADSSDPKLATTYQRLSFGGLKALGYGLIPKAVMQDQRLPIKAKGIYAYFAGYTGNGEAAFPAQQTILYHLQITNKTYYKHYQLLTDLNYITPVQRRIAGAFNVNDYYLNDNPDLSAAQRRVIVAVVSPPQLSPADPVEAAPPIKADVIKKATLQMEVENPDTVNETKLPQTQTNQGFSPIGKKPDTVAPPIGKKPDTINPDTVNEVKWPQTQINQGFSPIGKKPDTKKPDTKNPDTNNNNVNNKQSLKSISPSVFKKDKPAYQMNFSQKKSPSAEGSMEGSNLPESDEQISSALIWAEMKTEKKIPYWYLGDYQRLTTAIHIITHYDEEVQEYEKTSATDHPAYLLSHSIFKLFNEALIDMLTLSPNMMKLKGAQVSYRMVYDKLHTQLKYIDDPAYGIYFELQALIDVTTTDYELASKQLAAQGTSIKNQLQYMKACIWNALQTCDASLNSSLIYHVRPNF